MKVELPKEIWIHAGCYEGLDGKPICDRRWFVGQINPDDIRYVRADTVNQLPPERNPEVLERALELLFDMLYDGNGRRSMMDSCISQAVDQAARELESEAGK